MSLYVCSNYCKHCSSNAPAGRQAEKRKPHQFRLRLAVFLPRHTRGPWPSTHWQTRAPATRDVNGVSTKPLDQNSGHKWVKVNTMLSYRDLYDLCRTPLADFLDRVKQAAVATQRPSHRALESIERMALKSVLIASEMLANFLKLSHVAGAKSLELATPLVQAPYDVLRNNIGRLTKRPKFEKQGRSQSNHPLAKDPALVEMMVRHWAHVHGGLRLSGPMPPFLAGDLQKFWPHRIRLLAVGQTALCAVAASYSRHLRKRRWHPLALGGSRHLLGMCPGNPETGKADCVR